MIGYTVYWNDDKGKEQSGIVISKYSCIICSPLNFETIIRSCDYYIIKPIENLDDIIKIEHIECSKITKYVQPL